MAHEKQWSFALGTDRALNGKNKILSDCRRSSACLRMLGSDGICMPCLSWLLLFSLFLFHSLYPPLARHHHAYLKRAFNWFLCLFALSISSCSLKQACGSRPIPLITILFSQSIFFPVIILYASLFFSLSPSTTLYRAYSISSLLLPRDLPYPGRLGRGKGIGNITTLC